MLCYFCYFYVAAKTDVSVKVVYVFWFFDYILRANICIIFTTKDACHAIEHANKNGAKFMLRLTFVPYK